MLITLLGEERTFRVPYQEQPVHLVEVAMTAPAPPADQVIGSILFEDHTQRTFVLEPEDYQREGEGWFVARLDGIGLPAPAESEGWLIGIASGSHARIDLSFQVG